jgi:hypothetical protein
LKSKSGIRVIELVACTVTDITHCPGYEEKDLKQIRNVSAIIKKHSKDSPECSGSEMLVSTIYVCVNIQERSVPFPVFRIPGGIPEVRNSVMLHVLIRNFILVNLSKGILVRHTSLIKVRS